MMSVALLRTLSALLVAMSAAASAGVPAEGTGAPPKYAVLSLVADQLDLVTYEMHTGSLRDTNHHQTVKVGDPGLDRVVLGAADDALRKLDSGASVTLLTASSPDLYADQADLFSGGRLQLPEDVAAAIRQSRATRLVLVTKHRAEAELRAQHGYLGTGKLAGLGFYVDRNLRMRRSDTGERGDGFLAPFVYIKLSLVDVATFTVLGSETVTASTTLSAARNKDGVDAWGVLSPAEKVGIIERMVKREVTKTVPLLVSHAKDRP